MRVRILGCSATACRGMRTTALQVDDDILVDCGSGAGDLSLQEMAAIRHVFLSHAHLDHVLFLPLLSDAALAERNGPLTVHALPQTLDALRQHMFNGVLWPDYTRLPSPDQPYIRLTALTAGETVTLGSRRLTALPADHAIPAVGYLISSGDAGFAFSGDTGFCPAFWARLNEIRNLGYLMIETTLRDQDRALAERSGHTTPTTLAKGLSLLEQPVRLLITHIETDKRAAVQAEILAAAGHFHPQFLEGGEVFEL